MVALLTRLLVEMMNMKNQDEKLWFFLQILCPNFYTMKDNDDEVKLPCLTHQKPAGNDGVGGPKGESMGLSFFCFSQTALSPVSRAERAHAATALSAN